MISNKRYGFFLLLILLTYILGLFNTLMENDSAQFAVMAMRMVQENDFLHLFKGNEEYLDKPHMHYWLSALSYTIFGISDWAYRLPALLLTLLGAYSCYGLGKELYSQDAGKLSSLIFLTAQTIVLAGFDVRTDSVLTGFTIFSIWQFAVYIRRQNIGSIVLGAAGAALAFSTKGQIAIVVIGLPVFCHLFYQRKFYLLWNWKILLGVFSFLLVCSPMLYAYYIQFDLHPEKVIRGRDHRSGIFFIFWEQSFERMNGVGIGKANSDYFFFFHTFLWVFIPWTVLGLTAFFNNIGRIVKFRNRENSRFEILTLGGFTLIFVLISFAQFKLPHYLNITIPLMAVLCGGFLSEQIKNPSSRLLRYLLGVQYFVSFILVCAGFLILLLVFPGVEFLSGLFLCFIIGIFSFFVFEKSSLIVRLVSITILSSVFLNSIMNLHFYPNLLEHQGSSAMSKVIAEQDIPIDQIYKITNERTWPLDFYNRRPVPYVTDESVTSMKNVWLYGDKKDLERVKTIPNIDIEKVFSVDNFSVSRLNINYLNPNKRESQLGEKVIFYVN